MLLVHATCCRHVEKHVIYLTPCQVGGYKGIFQVVRNHQSTMASINGVMPTFAEAHSEMSRRGGAETVRLSRTMVSKNGIEWTHSTMSQRGAKGGAETICLAGTTESKNGIKCIHSKIKNESAWSKGWCGNGTPCWLNENI